MHRASSAAFWLLPALCATLLLAKGAASETLAERGGYLVNTIMACGNCHTPKDSVGVPIAGMDLAGGGLAFDTPTFKGTASNITPDIETGIGSWSDADIKRALTEGVRPERAALDGAPLAGTMPASFYKVLTPRDLDAVVAYLRSLPPVRNPLPPPTYKRPAVHDPHPKFEVSVGAGLGDDLVSRGAYLAGRGHCMECHTPFAEGRPDYEHALGRGGRQFGPALVQGFPAGWPGSVARNVTSHPTAGIGAWSDAEIKRAITQGISRDGRRLEPPMPFAWYAGLTEADLDALVAWLRTLPPLE